MLRISVIAILYRVPCGCRKSRVVCVQAASEHLPMMPFALLLVAALPQDHNLVPGGDEDGTRTIVAEPRCDPAAEDIVVCGIADPNRFRLKKVEPRYVEAPVRAATRLGPGEVSIEAEQRGFPQTTAPAAMVRFRLPFGKKPK
jgi:hypothetical protein